MKHKTLVSLFLLFTIFLIRLSPAAGTGAEIIAPQEKQNIPSVTGISNNQAAAMFVSRLMSGDTGDDRRRGISGYDALNEREKLLYNSLKPLISAVANGDRSSAEFVIPLHTVLDETYD